VCHIAAEILSACKLKYFYYENNICGHQLNGSVDIPAKFSESSFKILFLKPEQIASKKIY